LRPRPQPSFGTIRGPGWGIASHIHIDAEAVANRRGAESEGGEAKMRKVTTILASMLLAGLTLSAQAAELRAPMASKAGPTLIQSQHCRTEAICSSTGQAGITIRAVSNNPGCLSVTPAAAVTGANGCADFTVCCIDGECSGSITWTADNHTAYTEGYNCVTGVDTTVVYIPQPGPHGPQVVPSVGAWGLIGLTLLLMGVAIATLVVRRRRSF
jgi:hypothetical protein